MQNCEIGCNLDARLRALLVGQIRLGVIDPLVLLGACVGETPVYDESILHIGNMIMVLYEHEPCIHSK